MNDPDLFDPIPPGVQDDPPGIEEGLAALARTAGRAKNAAMIEQLVPIAQRLAAAAAPEGITCTELREEAVLLGLLTGYETGPTLSYLGAVMKRAGLHRGEVRRSRLTVTHGKIQVVWYASPVD